MSQIKKGAILSYVNIILVNVVGLFITPLMVSSLGDSEYGLYTLIGSLIAYFSLMDFGLNNTIIRFVAKYRVEKNKKKENKFLATIFTIYFGISFLVIVFGVIAYFNINTIFGDSLTDAELSKAKIMFLILVFNVSITIPGGSFAAICSGYEHFVFPRFVGVVKYISRSISLVILLLLGGDALSIVILDTIINIVFLLVNAYYVFKKLNVTIKLRNYDRSVMSEIFMYSLWIFILSIIAQFQWRSGQLVLGIFRDTSTVAVYGIGVMLGTYYATFSSAFSSLFLPKATKILHNKNESSQEQINITFINVGKIISIILFFILGAFLLFGKQFVVLWLNETYLLSWKIALIIMLVLTIPLSQSFANSVIEASKKVRFKAVSTLCVIVFGVLLGSILIKYYGAFGMIVGILIGRVLSELIMNVYYVRVIKLDVARFIKKVYSVNIIAFILVLFIGLLINELPGKGWDNFFLKILIYTPTYFLVFYFFANKKEQMFIREVVKKAF